MRAPILVEPRPNARWPVDFAHDLLSNGRRFRILNVIDDVTKERLAATADTPISGRHVAGSTGISSPPASRRRTGSARRSKAACATNCSTK